MEEENSNARVQGSLHKIKASIDGLKNVRLMETPLQCSNSEIFSFQKRSERREKRVEHSDNQPEKDTDDGDP